MSNPRFSLLLGISALAAAAACGDDTGSGGSGGSPSTTTGTTVTSSTSTATSTTTHHMECTTADECTVTGTACTEKVCEEGMCGLAMLAAGTPVPDEDVDGDCQRAVCDGQGNVTSEADDTDLPDDDNDCTIDGCNAGAVISTFELADEPCTSGGGAFCDGRGTCVECNDTEQCLGDEICVDHSCVPATCLDTTQNGNETDVDCGGADCPPCADASMCEIDDDCQSAFCHPTNLVCTAPACPDGFENGTETDLDCGGPSCPDCANGQGCLVNGDCVSGFCNPNTDVCAQPTCMDGISNGSETGVDCGGPTCGDCPDGQACMVDGDCQSGACINSVCSLINNCSLATAQDLTAMANVNVSFGSSLTYTPPCIKVAQGATVTFNGSFEQHPMIGGYVTSSLNPASSGPFVPATTTGGSMAFTMGTAGTFPYYCQSHAFSGMRGVVFVVP